MSKLTIYADGGSRGNPGPAACGAVFQTDQEVIAQSSWYLGEATNNQAEYQAVLNSLRFIKRNPQLFSQFQAVEFVLDSELVVKQLTGQYKIKNVPLQKLAHQVNQSIKELNLSANFRHVLRDKNHKADQLLNNELDLRQ